jgi:sterol desaturase/sphingolipid hydroxylase (fatty acid hydroxylase superfamily)
MDGRAVAVAIPLFFMLIAIEIAADFRRRKRGLPALYRFTDSIASLSCGVGQQLLQALAFGSVGVGIYDAIAARTAYVPWPSGALGYALAFVLVDLGYWAYHASSHRVNVLWAMHEVHHQSEEYNLSTALRQSWFTNLFSWAFYSPLAVLGVPTKTFVVCLTLNILYQFWIHTRTIDRLGPLEWVLNTPSHHRVHHGIDPEYIDKNHAGVFIVWDRLFGTFAAERKEPSYGLVKPLGSFSAYWSNMAGFARILSIARATSRWQDSLRAWIAPPEWLPADLGGPVTIPEVRRDARVLFDVPTRPRLFVYVGAQFLLASAAVFAVLWWSRALAFGERGAIVGVALLSVATWSGLFEGARWAVALEGVRLVATFGAIGFVFAGSPALPGALLAYAPLALGSAIGLARALREPVAREPMAQEPEAVTR